MRFDFDQEQLMFQTSLRGFLAKHCSAGQIRLLWDSDDGHSPERWRALAEIGLLGLLVPQEYGGLGMDERDLVLALEECGRVALPEPVAETAAVGVALLASLEDGEPRERWLESVVSGEVVVAVGDPLSFLVSGAGVADLSLFFEAGDLYAMEREQLELEPQPCIDPSLRLFSVRPGSGQCSPVARGQEARRLLEEAIERGALAVAAQQLGVGQQLIDMAVAYAGEREQFGRPIGSFQAVKHMLADAQIAVEFAKPVVYRAAYSVATAQGSRGLHVSHAKAAADEAATRAAKAALQVHGAIGYTWEADLHIWMKRAWALENSWGTPSWHRARVAEAILGQNGAAA
ncbi:MAG: acyl-CoA dehydrogenase family protein [Candidatus Binatia bacterium]